MPLALKRERNWRALGVLTGPHGWLPQLWALLSGKSFRITGYAVNAKNAVEKLAERNPSAAAWWRENTPQILDGRRNFLFNAAACEPEP